MAVGVLFNTFQTPVTANAAPPSLVSKPFGVAKFTRQDLNEHLLVAVQHLERAGAVGDHRVVELLPVVLTAVEGG